MKPWGQKAGRGDSWGQRGSSALAPAQPPPLSPPASPGRPPLALSLALSSGLSTGVCLVEVGVKLAPSSSDCCGRREGPGHPGRGPHPDPTCPLAKGLHSPGKAGGKGVHTAGQEVIPINVRKRGASVSEIAQQHANISTLAPLETPSALRPHHCIQAPWELSLPPHDGFTCTSAASRGPLQSAG